MLLGAVADDFTGASDLANTLAKGGMATTQFVGIGAGDAPAGCEAGVVALKTRSIAPQEAVRQSLEAARWLLRQGCRQIVFKYCSTFDSTPQGNIGPVAEALLDELGAEVAVVCPAFPTTGRRLFMGHLFVGDRLLNESGMENHPLNPMTDADIRRWLRHQTKGEVGHVPLHVVRGGAEAVGATFEVERSAGRRLVVADATSDEDLLVLGRAIAGHRLVTGGSGIAIGLPTNFREEGLLSPDAEPLPRARGLGVVLCGSCSRASQAQVRAYLERAPGLAIDPAELVARRMTAELAADWVCRRADALPIVYSTSEPSGVTTAQERFGREEIAGTIERFFGELARSLADSGYRRIVVGGGETSGAVVEALGVKSMRIGPEIDPGVPALVADRNGPLGLALKSGNFGASDFFEKALRQVGLP
ncbi:four-carbon acid sugar kinase family protein [Pseudaminobacter sp. 19-2017]|uniref:3-oxo-tetronate kinase n=1 Tax=Pseudaminobacter soli (ex Zhang et al. 2022) TaxID=2831468 RepID=A0A942IA86_9HYPH|nr:3-oxo-tetronate kinase [Pseudaminobacter soli]MBS3651095.1 four-carbon acid sugar kinase family protein [Pseudaminobacter soli]